MGQLHAMKHEVSALVEYARICAQLHCTTGGGFYEDIMRHPLTATLFTQYSVRKGIKLFEEAAIIVVKEELQQLESRKVMEPIDGTEMTWEENRVCLQYLMFLKQKRSGRIKGRGCADVQKQREFITKEESSAPNGGTFFNMHNGCTRKMGRRNNRHSWCVHASRHG